MSMFMNSFESRYDCWTYHPFYDTECHGNGASWVACASNKKKVTQCRQCGSCKYPRTSAGHCVLCQRYRPQREFCSCDNFYEVFQKALDQKHAEDIWLDGKGRGQKGFGDGKGQKGKGVKGGSVPTMSRQSSFGAPSALQLTNSVEQRLEAIENNLNVMAELFLDACRQLERIESIINLERQVLRLHGSAQRSQPSQHCIEDGTTDATTLEQIPNSEFGWEYAWPTSWTHCRAQRQYAIR